MKIRTSIMAMLLAFSTIGMAQTTGTAATNQSGNQKITNGPVIEYTSDHSAMIAWSTKQAGGTYVAYGTDRNNLNQRTQKAWGGTNHRLEIKNLQPSTTYYFQIRSENAQGSGADVQSDVAQFTTVAKGAQPDRQNKNVGVMGEPTGGSTSGSGSTSAQISNGPMIEQASDKNAIIAWTTKSQADMSVKYGTDRNNLSQNADATENAGGTNHRVTLSNLQPNTTYFFQVLHNGQPVGNVMQVKTVAPGSAPMKNQMAQQ